MAGGLGAEYFYGFHGPGVSQWYPPLWENTTPVRAPRTPEEGYHLEADMADKTIAFIQRQKSIHPNKPWIVYYAPSAHKPPVGVPREWITKYRGRFDDGYDQLRDRILARQQQLGIVPADTKLQPRPAALPAWEELSDTDSRSGPAGWRCSALRWSTPTTRSAASSTRSRRPASWTTPWSSKSPATTAPRPRVACTAS